MKEYIIKSYPLDAEGLVSYSGDGTTKMLLRIGHWKEKKGSYMTPGGTPIYVCAKCGGSEHLHGVEYPRRKVFCEACGTVNLYPWERAYEEEENG